LREIDQRRLHAPVDVSLLGQLQLGEDRVPGGSPNTLVGPAGRHPDIGNDHFGRQATDCGFQRAQVLGHADQLKVRCRFDHLPDAFAHEVVVFRDHHTDRHA
jgi:hypothetical protein